ncbi:ribosomal protein L5 [Tilletiaria anomala UBC 951]|uniref:Ribosomal protein L5 n=1 Tax=Tilletiaria anomala (strain ATCC 24038 / CBS 436.72 / UBC 951) TaxID=1037660 RepID=A0A066VAM1_TILAU|nr:ribosomal protein L5 [Tilletiaria anomala UBC 951]KDN38516.1 ribosomal protein L5 [Tilletiaria anomala UBC 951]
MSNVASTSRQVLRSSAQGGACGVSSVSRAARAPAWFLQSTPGYSPISASTSRGFASSSRRSLDHVPPRNIFSPLSVEIGPLGLNRLEEMYRNTLALDLMYMTYDHISPEDAAAERERKINKHKREWDPSDPYTKNRPARPLRGNRRPPPGPTHIITEDPARNLVKLDRVIITCFVKDAIVNKNLLVPLLSQFRAITGLPVIGSNASPADLNERNSTQGHIQIIRAKSGVAVFKLRKGMPVGVKAVLPGPIAHSFIDTLVNFVLPRLRTFNGFLLPPPNQPPMSPAALSGVVSLGIGPEALPLFPQLEVNWDSYPGKSYGFQIDCVTNQRGKKATDKARTLLSGMGVPFVRRSDLR